MGFSMNTVYLSGIVLDYTDATPIDFGNGVPVKKTTILLQYDDPNNGKQYKIPIEVVAGDNKMGLVLSNLKKGIFMSLEGRLVSTQYNNKNTGKEVTFIKVDPYTINFPDSGHQVIMKQRFTGNIAPSYPSNSPYKNLSVGEAQQVVQEKIDSMRTPAQQPQAPFPPKQEQNVSGRPVNIDLEEPIPF